MKRWHLLAVAGVILAGVGVGFCWLFVAHHGGDTLLPPSYHSQAITHASVPKLDHVVIIVMENHGEDAIIGNRAAPYLNQLATQYSYAGNYYATAHPSLPNYLEMTSGTNAGITNDCSPSGGSCLAHVKNIADEIEVSGRNWKEYAEDMPTACTTHNAGEYVTKHNPFVYYPDILNNQKRCAAHVVPFAQLRNDLRNNSLPAYSFITPNLCHDMHNCSVQVGDGWLRRQVPTILDSPAFAKDKKSLLVITWDEAEGGGPNHIPAIFAGPIIKKGYVTKTVYSHYSLLHTVEKSWGLSPLTENDKTAPVINDIFK